MLLVLDAVHLHQEGLHSGISDHDVPPGENRNIHESQVHRGQNDKEKAILVQFTRHRYCVHVYTVPRGANHQEKRFRGPEERRAHGQ